MSTYHSSRELGDTQLGDQQILARPQTEDRETWWVTGQEQGRACFTSWPLRKGGVLATPNTVLVIGVRAPCEVPQGREQCGERTDVLFILERGAEVCKVFQFAGLDCSGDRGGECGWASLWPHKMKKKEKAFLYLKKKSL